MQRRASGRRAYNAWRHDMAMFRRIQVAKLLGQYGFVRGAQRRIARQLGVSEATISRDTWAILRYRPAP